MTGVWWYYNHRAVPGSPCEEDLDTVKVSSPGKSVLSALSSLSSLSGLSSLSSLREREPSLGPLVYSLRLILYTAQSLLRRRLLCRVVT